MNRKIVCLCGSTRFKAIFEYIAMKETLAGNIVLTVHVFSHADRLDLDDKTSTQLKALHLDKIQMADEILIINPGNYNGEGLKEELTYARNLGKVLRWLEPQTPTLRDSSGNSSDSEPVHPRVVVNGEGSGQSKELMYVDKRDALIALINSQYLSGVYHCTRVWSAWSVGTMTEDDFEPASESSLASEIVDAILNELQTATRSRPATRDLAEGEVCPAGCDATAELITPKSCSCHLSPPCQHCVENRPQCPQCGCNETVYEPIATDSNVRPETPRADTNRLQTQCLDMLGRDVVVGDVLWDTSTRILFSSYPPRGKYPLSVRVPRPGEAVPEFDGWRGMCLAMREAGVKFQGLNSITGQWDDGHYEFYEFTVFRDEYRRSPSCTWKMPVAY